MPLAGGVRCETIAMDAPMLASSVARQAHGRRISEIAGARKRVWLVASYQDCYRYALSYNSDTSVTNRSADDTVRT